jgi:hypothetical protein
MKNLTLEEEDEILNRKYYKPYLIQLELGLCRIATCRLNNIEIDETKIKDELKKVIDTF